MNNENGKKTDVCRNNGMICRNETDLYEVGDRIQQQRKKRGMSQRDLGMFMDMDANTISRYERGDREMRISTFFCFAEALECSTEQIAPERLFEGRSRSMKARKLMMLSEKLSESDLDLLIRMAERMDETG